ncbi:hypothetical protein BaRGS_00021169, partial [Batillaria attramentaria]
GYCCARKGEHTDVPIPETEQKSDNNFHHQRARHKMLVMRSSRVPRPCARAPRSFRSLITQNDKLWPADFIKTKFLIISPFSRRGVPPPEGAGARCLPEVTIFSAGKWHNVLT